MEMVLVEIQQLILLLHILDNQQLQHLEQLQLEFDREVQLMLLMEEQAKLHLHKVIYYLEVEVIQLNQNQIYFEMKLIID